MMTIMDMLGVPTADQPAMAKAAEKLFSMSDDEYSTLEARAQDTITEIMLLSSTEAELAKFRRANLGDDLTTSNVEVDGHRLTDEEIGAFLILLASAGNDTTKQTTTHAMMALVENPAQRDWLMEDFENRIGPAVEECIRWASPVMQFACFATEDTEINGHPVPAAAEPQVPHFCVGNQLAKAELRNLFRELLTRLTRVEFSEPDLLYSNFVHGVKRLPAFVQ